MMIALNLLAVVAALSSWLSTPVLAQDGGLLQPVLPDNLRQCSTVTLSWSETPATTGAQRYAVRVVNSSTVGLELAAEVPLTWLGWFSEETSHDWRVAIPSGTNITLLVTDQSGNRGYSAPVVVQNGSARCLPKEYEPNFFQGGTGGAGTTIASSGLLLTALIGTTLAAIALTTTV